MRQPEHRHLAFEGMWPVVAGAATPAQAKRVIDEHLLNPKEFFTAHPIAAVARSDAKFERRMWRGPAWNCMTYWAARGCAHYGRADAAKQLLEKALDATATEFQRSGTLWEFYDAESGDQNTLAQENRQGPAKFRAWITSATIRCSPWSIFGGLPAESPVSAYRRVRASRRDRAPTPPRGSSGWWRSAHG